MAGNIMLIVGGANTQRTALRKMFSEEFEILEALNGFEALQPLRNRTQELAIILLDIGKPEWNSVRLLSEIHHHTEYQGIPILAFTAAGEAQLNALRKGAWDAIVRPGSEAVIRARVAAALRTRRRTVHESLLSEASFLSTVSHDVRTPMNAIICMAKIALEEPNQRAQRQSLATIISSAEHLLHFVEDMLDVSRLSAEQEYPDDLPFEMSKLIEGLRESCESMFTARKQSFRVQRTGSPRDAFIGDKARTIRLLCNLLANASRVAPDDGRITLSIHLKERVANNHTRALFTITDDGPSVVAGYAERLQSNNLLAMPDDETVGLNMFIVRSLTDALGGVLQADALPDRGSAFSVELDFRNSYHSEVLPHFVRPKPDVPANLLTDLRLLVVDDHPVNTMVAKALFESYGAQVDTASDGQQACDMFEKSGCRDYAAVFMDLLMPGMNGYEAARIIRAMPRQDALTVPILAMTASVFTDSISQAITAGMNGHICKPIDILAVSEALRKAEVPLAF